MTSMSYHYLVSLTSVSQIIAETCQALWEILSPLVLMQCNQKEWKAIAHDFNEKWHFPHVLELWKACCHTGIKYYDVIFF